MGWGLEQLPLNTQALNDTAWTMVAGDKDLLAMEESIPKCNTRFEEAGIPQVDWPAPPGGDPVPATGPASLPTKPLQRARRARKPLGSSITP